MTGTTQTEGTVLATKIVVAASAPAPAPPTSVMFGGTIGSLGATCPLCRSRRWDLRDHQHRDDDQRKDVQQTISASK